MCAVLRRRWRQIAVVSVAATVLVAAGGDPAFAGETGRELPETGAPLTPWFLLATVLLLVGTGLLAFHAHSKRRG